MSLRSVISIDVNDAQFRQFNALFQQYSRQLQSMPLTWRTIGQAQAQGVKGFRELVDAQVASIGHAKIMAEVEAKALQLTRTRAEVWKDMKSSASDMLGSVKATTVTLLRWTAIGGLIGGGSLFGLDRLAASAAASRQRSLGLGSSVGSLASFKSAFDRFVDPDSTLGFVNNALTDRTQRYRLFGAGLGERDLAGKDTAQVSEALLVRLKHLADTTDPANYAQTLSARGLEQFSAQDLTRLRNTSPEEFNRQRQQFRDNRSRFEVDPRDQRAWQDLDTSLENAAQSISKVFIRGLSPLIPGIDKLSQSVVKSIETLAAAIPPDSMERIGKGIEEFAKVIGTKDFQDGVKAFGAGLAWIAKQVINLGIWAGSGSTGGALPGGDPKTTTGIFSDKPLLNLGPLGTIDPRVDKGSVTAGVISAIGVNPWTVKPGAGSIDPGIGALAQKIAGNVSGIDRFTAFNDEFHKGTSSAHNDDRAFDFTIKDKARSAEIAQQVRDELARMKIQGVVIDEYLNPSRNATAGHIHVQTSHKVAVDVVNSTGGNAIVSTHGAVPQ